MLSIFDWLRKSYCGAELLATLEYVNTNPDLFPMEVRLGPPLTAFSKPCQRCWIYPCMISDEPDLKRDQTPKSSRRRVYEPSRNSCQNYCRTCRTVLEKTKTLGKISYQSIVVWGFVNHMPDHLRTRQGFYADKVISFYVHDENHFLMVLGRRELKFWLQELLIYHGTTLKGLIQVFPTVGDGSRGAMGEIIARAAHQEARFPMDILRIRFFSSPFQIFSPHTRDEEGLLTFEVTEFLRLLEMAEIFRSLLRPEEQKALHELINLDNTREEQFYWGRFMGHLGQKAKDMLNAWKIRQWSHSQVKLLYELVDYVFHHH